jgi:cation diffusion facilitator CzcD-associated flavoprotein CzcO
MTLEHFDVLIVGAGLSGIGAACHLQRECPQHRFAILENRQRIGGTWDLFRYPGVRSDSDMYTLGYAFKPWEQPQAIASGDAIRNYVQETAEEHGVDRLIRFGHKVISADWSASQARWTLQIERAEQGDTVQMSCNFLLMCAGYYSYDQGYAPAFPGSANFRGRIVHPQHWTPDIDYAGKRVVVIGSGATAVTLVPEMAKAAAHVTMLQRSPTWVVARPAEDAMANQLRSFLPAMLAYGITRWKRILLGMYVFSLCRRKPELASRLLLKGVRTALGPDYDVDKHFTPRYRPWDQRVCLVPDGDLFATIRSGRASVVTDEIETFTGTGIRLKSGEELAADLIVTATGLNLNVLGGLRLSLDGQPVDLSKTLNYKGLMYSGVPNLASCFGYTNASWTLKCDLTCDYVCRLLNHMKAKGLASCTPRNKDPSIQAEPWIDFSSGYFQRARDILPRQGSRAPWKLYQNYPRDILMLRHGRIEDGVLEFERATSSGQTR